MKKTSVFTKLTAAALAILTLMFTLCITSFATENEGGADLYIGSKVYRYDDISQAWIKAMTSEDETRIVLRQDWVTDENGSFGSGKYFPGGAIGILTRHKAFTLDLNGYKIDRGLKSAASKGNVFSIDNSIDITIEDTSEAQTGLITGGNSKGKGGAFVIVGSRVKISNVTIKGNVSEDKGGAFWIEKIDFDDESLLSIVTLKNCLVTENKANKGGAVYIETSNRIKIFDSVITKNSAVEDGGIHTEVYGLVRSSITLGGKVIIADNIAEKDGTGLMLDENFFIKVVIQYDSARPLVEGSRIVVLSKTDDKTLRITEDSSDSCFDFFEYENDSYEIVMKGSGDEQYLDIKKA